jgi:hypothetical protein
MACIHGGRRRPGPGRLNPSGGPRAAAHRRPGIFQRHIAACHLRIDANHFRLVRARVVRRWVEPVLGVRRDAVGPGPAHGGRRRARQVRDAARATPPPSSSQDAARSVRLRQYMYMHVLASLARSTTPRLVSMHLDLNLDLVFSCESSAGVSCSITGFVELYSLGARRPKNTWAVRHTTFFLSFRVCS